MNVLELLLTFIYRRKLLLIVFKFYLPIELNIYSRSSRVYRFKTKPCSLWKLIVIYAFGHLFNTFILESNCQLLVVYLPRTFVLLPIEETHPRVEPVRWHQVSSRVCLHHHLALFIDLAFTDSSVMVRIKLCLILSHYSILTCPIVVLC